MVISLKKYALISLVMAILSCETFIAFAATSNKQQTLEKILNVAQNTAWFEQGNPNAPHQIYLIADPNCSACHYFYDSVKPYIARGQLTVRWILVAFLRPSSLGKAAAIMSAKNCAQALEGDEANFSNTAESGGIRPLIVISSKLERAITNNLRFMNHCGFRATPVILFRTTTGEASAIQGALPQNQVSRLISVIGKYQNQELR